MKIKDTIRDFLYRQIFPLAGFLFLKLICRTYRYRFVGTDHEQGVYDAHGSVVYATWHQRFFPGIILMTKRRPIAVMISRSRDGEMVARVVDRLGGRAVRGSSSRGGGQALKETRSLTRKGFRIVHIVDGPQGPIGVIKPGLLTIAQFAGAPIVPAIMSPERYWAFNGWDRFRVPKPFSRIFIRFCPPIAVPRRLDNESFEALRRKVQEQIKELYVETDNWWRRPEIIRHYFP